MNAEVVGLCLLIVLARIADVSIGTIRTIMVVHGRAFLAWILGFFEILIWLVVVSNVINNLHKPVYAVAYALGFATGNYMGVILEKRLALGKQMVRIFTTKGEDLAALLRSDGFKLTEFKGQGRDGPVSMIFIEAPRRQVADLLDRSGMLDPECFCVVDDVRFSARCNGIRHTPTGWRAILKKK